jgi:hypothetical protein
VLWVNCLLEILRTLRAQARAKKKLKDISMLLVQRLIARVRLCSDVRKAVEGMRPFAPLRQRMTQTA